ncbi:glycerophosphodiester phosphodiesterase family protein [Microtetraspora sp. NBRC 16547]|uniref:glycerophosphodiester phosphodiesterase n=1 Tax=Microtetraspora sp. NBRC 16547 TaxID=3030993 RepID=UPI0024A5E447|nr:glycerophosphodiester phosphodiesterase family protein [Microtetraspora sp. NBRC 16547]GLX01384.1 putative glycerophosphoryl diester phosphodiesterase YhdW [Microtetraspora sp. NBRC 16547]
MAVSLPNALGTSLLVITMLDPSAGPTHLAISSSCPAPRLASHRGYGTENTLAAFASALDAGSEQVEFDVHFTSDHQPVLMHDATVDRTTTGTGRVADMTLAEFRALRTANGERPPTLAAALRLVRDRGGRAMVELKEVPDAEDVRELREIYTLLNARRWASMTSFIPAALRAVGSIGAARGLLSSSALSVSAAKGFSFVSVRYDRLTTALVQEYRAAGFPVYAFTPNDEVAWRRLADYGVSGVVTDRTPAYLDWARSVCPVPVTD